MGQLIKTADAGLFVGLFVSFATYLSRCPSETTVVSDSVYERSGMRVSSSSELSGKSQGTDASRLTSRRSSIHELHVYEEV